MLTGLSLVMRFFSFFPSVMDHDESTYLVIADALRHGDVYLRDVIDTKPSATRSRRMRRSRRGCARSPSNWRTLGATWSFLAGSGRWASVGEICFG